MLFAFMAILVRHTILRITRTLHYTPIRHMAVGKITDTVIWGLNFLTSKAIVMQVLDIRAFRYAATP